MMRSECSGKEVGEMQSAPPHRDLLSAGDVPRTAHGPHTTGTVPAGAESASSAACTRPCVRPCVVSNYADRCFCTLRPALISPARRAVAPSPTLFTSLSQAQLSSIICNSCPLHRLPGKYRLPATYQIDKD